MAFVAHLHLTAYVFVLQVLPTLTLTTFLSQAQISTPIRILGAANPVCGARQGGANAPLNGRWP